MNDNLFAGGILGAFLLKEMYDQSVRRDQENTRKIVEAIEDSSKPTTILVSDEKEFQLSKRVWPFI